MAVKICRQNVKENIGEACSLGSFEGRGCWKTASPRISPPSVLQLGGGASWRKGLWVRDHRSGKRPELGPKNPRLPGAPASSSPPPPCTALSGPSHGAWKVPGETFRSNAPSSSCSGDTSLSWKAHPISVPVSPDPSAGRSRLRALPSSRSRAPKMQGPGTIQSHAAWRGQVPPVLKVRQTRT